MASKHSRTKKRQQNAIVSFILTIGRIELLIIGFIAQWIVSIICIVLGIGISYATFYCFLILPPPANLSQYQKLPSISIYDTHKNLLYKEWNTQRNMISMQKTLLLKEVLPSKEQMTNYLTNQNTKLRNEEDKKWFQKKMMYLYPYTSIAATYINAKIFQDGVVGGADAAEVYFQKNLLSLEKFQVKQLMSINGFTMNKNIYARMPTEVSAVRSYIKNIITKKTGWIRIDTSLDAHIGTAIVFQSLIDPSNETIAIEGNRVRAWTQNNNQLLAAQAIQRITEGGENK